ncbi:energy-coupling factor transport system substrate-specific component [Lentibacillus persicus]|uniref:Energy-coupling factor transport system substrate-specific component n=1 Tax=Lentibacillus persicus TaxID=640948 RepID=A0A1I1X7D9_9BACI|nr:ECF transporter S component [Lentibacillus persicus]SFE03335.1 energy-coupling factor transport system substrate-specific component [Lentibacillus persicus]
MTKQWKLKEIVLMSVLGVVFGVIYLLFFLVGEGLRNILVPFGLAPLGYEVIYGVWFIVSIMAAYILRKPGAAFTAEFIAGVVEVLLGTAAGPGLLLSAAIQGAGAELVFAITKWKDYRLRILILAGVSTAIISFAWHLYFAGMIALAPWLLASALSVRIISAALISGVFGKWLSDQLAKTGVLRGYALGKELQRKQKHDTA